MGVRERSFIYDERVGMQGRIRVHWISCRINVGIGMTVISTEAKNGRRQGATVGDFRAQRRASPQETLKREHQTGYIGARHSSGKPARRACDCEPVCDSVQSFVATKFPLNLTSRVSTAADSESWPADLRAARRAHAARWARVRRRRYSSLSSLSTSVPPPNQSRRA